MRILARMFAARATGRGSGLYANPPGCSIDITTLHNVFFYPLIGKLGDFPCPRIGKFSKIQQNFSRKLKLSQENNRVFSYSGKILIRDRPGKKPQEEWYRPGKEGILHGKRPFAHQNLQNQHHFYPFSPKISGMVKIDVVSKASNPRSKSSKILGI